MKIARIGPIEVLAPLGQGAKSTVMHVRRAADGRDYALKVVPVARRGEKKYLAQAEQEYRVGQMFDHPSLVRVYCLETESDWLFRVRRAKLLAEYVPGQTLDLVPPQSLETLVRVFERVAEGVAHMHARGVVHADLKPNNVILGPGVVKVIDFGLARVDGESSGRLQGTPEYMAPETVTQKAVNERTDVFNLGATMYRLVTAQLPPSYIAGLPMGEKTYRSRLRPVAELNPLVPVALADLIHRCLSYHPHHRPASMDEVYDALRRLVNGYAAEEV